MNDYKAVRSSLDISRSIAFYLEMSDPAAFQQADRARSIRTINDILQGRSERMVEAMLAELEQKGGTYYAGEIAVLRQNIQDFQHQKMMLTQPCSERRRTPSEQSLQELCRRCNEAVWCNYTHKAKFERKYAIISFLNFFCSFRNDKEYWTFTNSMKAILPCAAHFETGALNEYPAFFQARRSMGPTAAINWIFQDVRNWCSCGCLRTGEWISAFPARTMPVSLSMLILAEAIRNLLGRWWHEVPVPSSPFQSGAAPNAQ